jgi:predicted 2-oxoglutarate/Fe(II)-dependent dioxygenase YbiX
MPNAAFFGRFGLFVREQFLEPELCARLCDEIRTGMHTPGTVGSTGSDYIVDREVRRVTRAWLADETDDLVRSRLLAIMPDVGRHFEMPLADCQAPQFLRYLKGDFYQRHWDATVRSDSAPASLARKVSCVIFLNANSREPREATYGGGALTFYSLFEEPASQDLGLPLDAEPGLLIAFNAHMPHSVELVTHGERFTVATWFI